VTPHRLVLAGRARLAVLRIGAWWKENRRAAPRAFDDELAHALELIALTPAAGEPWRSQKLPGVRRWLLEKTRYHVYYTADEESRTVTVRMVWYAGRKRGPKL
jgi:plasmid stabilization system protein ParE